MNYDELEKLNALREKGAITEEEYQREKEKILNRSPLFQTGTLLGFDLNTYCMIMHLSQFAGFIFPLGGFIAPVILWLLNKEKHPQVDAHGKVIINWTLSFLIYGGICTALMILLIGFPLMVALAVLSVIFIIAGAMKASSGILWPYPFSIEFLKINSSDSSVS